jgi:hypothetical protein
MLRRTHSLVASAAPVAVVDSPKRDTWLLTVEGAGRSSSFRCAPECRAPRATTSGFQGYYFSSGTGSTNE